MKSNVLKWFRGEYASRKEAKDELGINFIVTDKTWYDFLKIFAAALVGAGYKGMLVVIDELVNIFKLPNSITRANNYEKILTMYNDVLQGKAKHIGFLLGGTTQCIEDKYKGVFSFNSYNLISYIDSMNGDVFTDDPFFIGGALNINSLQFANELKRAQKKISNGVGFLMTQPVLSQYAIENLNIAYKELQCKIITGILPVASYRNAVFLKNEVFGIDIPDTLISELENKSFEEAFKISIKFSADIIDKTFDFSDGYYLITPLKRIDLMKELIRYINGKPDMYLGK